MNISSVFFQTAKKNIDRIAIEHAGGQLTSQVTEKSGKTDRLIHAGEPVNTYLSPEVDLIVALPTIARSNDLFSLVNPCIDSQRQRNIFALVMPALVITQYKCLAAIGQIAKAFAMPI